MATCCGKCWACGRAPVTPFAVINDTDHRVTVVLEQAMMEHDTAQLSSSGQWRTTAIKSADLLKFLRARATKRRLPTLPEHLDAPALWV